MHCPDNFNAFDNGQTHHNAYEQSARKESPPDFFIWDQVRQDFWRKGAETSFRKAFENEANYLKILRCNFS